MAVSMEARAPAWLRDRNFDLNFLFAITALALFSGWAAIAYPKLAPLIILADLWLLGYHHVLSTYTRLCFDGESARKHRFLLFGLPWIVLVATALIVWQLGVWAVITLYFYWQWFHYGRQSWGVGKAYQRKAQSADAGLRFDGEWLAQATYWAAPVFGIIYRSWQGHQHTIATGEPVMFVGMELKVFAVPFEAVVATGIVAGILIGQWAVRSVVDYLRGRTAILPLAYLATHHIIFLVGYVLIEDITAGWLVANVWHNAQYIGFVWLQNAQKYKNGVDEKAIFISSLSQPNNFWLYMLVCFALSAFIYMMLGHVAAGLASAALVTPIFLFMVLNFHHYIVDAVIWRKPRAKTP
jgi:hypothetical protein